MRYQIVPGLALLIAAPVLIVLLALTYNIWVALVALLGFLSMFRRPLIHLARRLRGRI